MERDLTLEETKQYDVAVTLVDGGSATEEWRVFDFVPRRDKPGQAIAAEPVQGRVRR